MTDAGGWSINTAFGSMRSEGAFRARSRAQDPEPPQASGSMTDAGKGGR